MGRLPVSDRLAAAERHDAGARALERIAREIEQAALEIVVGLETRELAAVPGTEEAAAADAAMRVRVQRRQAALDDASRPRFRRGDGPRCCCCCCCCDRCFATTPRLLMEHLKARGPQAAERSPHPASSRRRRLAWYDAVRLPEKGRTVGKGRSEEEGCLSLPPWAICVVPPPSSPGNYPLQNAA